MTKWKTMPISSTCEALINRAGDVQCGMPTEMCYKAQVGWMALCKKHSVKHTDAIPVVKLIVSGERFE